MSLATRSVLPDADDLVIHAVALYRAAVCEHNGLAIAIKQAAEVLLNSALAEIYLCLVSENKIVHINASFRLMVINNTD